MCKIKGHTTTIVTAISKTVVSLLRFVFIDNTGLVSAVEDGHMSNATMIERFQALMTC